MRRHSAGVRRRAGAARRRVRRECDGCQSVRCDRFGGQLVVFVVFGGCASVARADTPPPGANTSRAESPGRRTATCRRSASRRLTTGRARILATVSSRTLEPISSFLRSGSTRIHAASSAVCTSLPVAVRIARDCRHNDLAGRQPHWQLARVGLAQDAAEALERSRVGAVKPHGPAAAV